MVDLPPWQEWGTNPHDSYSEFDDTLYNLETALEQGVIQACNITRSGKGFQVSVRRDTDGWEVYNGSDIGETIARAVMAGPQNEPPPKPKDTAHTPLDWGKVLHVPDPVAAIALPAPSMKHMIDATRQRTGPSVGRKVCNCANYLDCDGSCLHDVNPDEDAACQPFPEGIPLDFDSAKW
jgi:hypothetical protein